MSARRAGGRRRAVSVIELLVVLSLLAMVILVLTRLQLFSGQSGGVDSLRAAYYQRVGLLLEQLGRDLKCAVSVQGGTDTLRLALPDGQNAFATIPVTWRVDRRAGAVIREAGAQRQSFALGGPLRDGDGLVFAVRVGAAAP